MCLFHTYIAFINVLHKNSFESPKMLHDLGDFSVFHCIEKLFQIHKWLLIKLDHCVWYCSSN